MKAVAIILAFLVVLLLGYLSIGFIATQPAPTNQTALNQYNNLTNTTSIAFQGYDGALLLLILAGVMAALFMLVKIVR